MLSSNTETVSTFFFFFFCFNEIDVALYDSLAQGICGAVQLAVAFGSILLKIAVARYLF